MAGPINRLTFDRYYKRHTFRTILKDCFYKDLSSASAFSITECRKIELQLRNRIANARARSRQGPKSVKEKPSTNRI